MGQIKLPVDHEALLYHPASGGGAKKRNGFFSVLAGGDHAKAKKRQHTYRLDQLTWVLSNLNPNVDQWISQGEFIKPNRRVVNLVRIGTMFVDLDTYHVPAIGQKTPDAQAHYVRFFCAQEGIPQPTVIVYSGRGLQVKWILDRPLPAAALPRWNACQKVLVDALAEIGADRIARDASRVLRVENTVNTKSGEVVRVVDFNGIYFDFDNLADDLLPLSREQLRIEREKLKSKKARQQLTSISSDLDIKSGLKKYSKSPRQLAWDRLNDLRKLTAMRDGFVTQNMRTAMLHWQLNFLLLSGATNFAQMYVEAAELSKQIGSTYWAADHNHLSTLYLKAKDFAAGKRITAPNGRQYPPLYTPKNQTLIDIFGITETEQKSLSTIISSSEARERDRLRKEARRRAGGVLPRLEYETNRAMQTAQRRAEALMLRNDGLSYREIAKKMGISIASISAYLAN